MSLRIQLRRIVIMMIIEYAVPSLALNYPCKEYQIIYESVHIYLCTCMRNKYLCKSEFVWNVHIQVMLKLISFSILNMHELVETWLPEEYFWNSQTDNQMYTFSDQMNWQFVQILMDSKFHSKLRVLDTDDVKQKTSLFSVQGKSAWYCFKAVALLFYVICVRYTKQMPKVPSEPSSPLIYSMNWLWMQSTEWTDLIGNPISACRLICGSNISLMEYV